MSDDVVDHARNLRAPRFPLLVDGKSVTEQSILELVSESVLDKVKL